MNSRSRSARLLLCAVAAVSLPLHAQAKGAHAHSAHAVNLSKSPAFLAVQRFWQARQSGSANAAFQMLSSATAHIAPFEQFRQSKVLSLDSPDEPKGAAFQRPVSAVSVFFYDVANTYQFRFQPYALDPANPHVVLVSYVTPYVSTPQAFRVVTMPGPGGPKLDLVKSMMATDPASTIKARQRALERRH